MEERCVCSFSMLNSQRPLCLDANASLFSSLMFFWLTPLIFKGNRVPLEDKDLWELRDLFRCADIMKRYKAVKRASSGLYMNLLRVIWKLLVLQVFLGFATTIVIASIS